MYATGMCPPNYHTGFGRARLVFHFDKEMQSQVEKAEADKKTLDKKPSPTNNPIMCMNIKFSTAVTLAMKSLTDDKGSFSSYEVTTKLRDMVNKGEVAFTDRTAEDIGGVTTFRVEAVDVKAIVEDAYAARLFNRTNNGSYFTYTPVAKASGCPVAAPVQPTPVQTFQVTAPVSTPVPVAKVPVPAVTLPPTQKLKDYLNGRGAGSQVTMKQVQSRFDSLKGVTCGAYALQLESLGYPVTKNGTNTSQWFVTVK